MPRPKPSCCSLSLISFNDFLPKLRYLSISASVFMASWPTVVMFALFRQLAARTTQTSPPDRKSTRLNSSHRTISYAVFCLQIILILNSFLGSSDSLVFSEFFHSLAPRPLSALFPYTTLFRSFLAEVAILEHFRFGLHGQLADGGDVCVVQAVGGPHNANITTRSEEHTSELQSPYDLVCRLLLANHSDSEQLLGK